MLERAKSSDDYSLATWRATVATSHLRDNSAYAPCVRAAQGISNVRRQSALSGDGETV